jgi:hypothetical protein
MFRRTPTDILELSIDGEHYVFHSPREFEFALAGRTSVPAPKIAALSRLTDDALLREADAIRAVEERFSSVLSGALEDITTIGPKLKSMEPSIISQDNGWRSIIAALNAFDEIPASYKKVALVKYTQYLAARQELVKCLYANRHEREEDASGTPRASAVYRPTARFRETMLFDLRDLADMERHEIAFSRLPKGETVELNLEREGAVELLLAKHQCRILLTDKLLFVDERGHDSELHAGTNVVGRDASSDIVIDASLRDVSRKHLIVESDGVHHIKLTDISSHGTSLPPRYLDQTSI